ncbi:MAG: DCC1-like thiol-disulfide oxidoreductase family protein [Bdellovibrionota bacterium]
MFPWMCMAAWMLFLPSDLWNWITVGVIQKSGQNVGIFFDADCGFCKKSVYIIRHLLLIENASISEGQSDPEIFRRMQERNSWIVRDSSGKYRDRYDAFIALVDESPFSCVLKPITSFLPVCWIGSKLYHWVSHHREIAGHLTSPLQWNEKPYRYTKIHTALVTFFMILVLLNNLDTVRWKNIAAAHLFRVPQSLKMVNRILRTDQAWDMFSPRPLGTNSWYFVEGTTLSGKEMVLINEDPRENPKRPAILDNLTDNHRWSKYSRNLAEDDDETYLLHYGKYLCRQTNKELGGKDALEKFTIKLIKQKTSLDKPQPYRESVLWKHRCIKK